MELVAAVCFVGGLITGVLAAWLLFGRERLELHQRLRDEIARRAAAEGRLESQGTTAPVGDLLSDMRTRLERMELARASAEASLAEQVRTMRGEASNLARALRSPNVRGRWGEVQLRRVVELAGMLERCDFTEQHSIDSDTGRLRPDLIVHLPNRRTVVVDAKAPMTAYLESLQAASEPERAARMRSHSEQVRAHLKRLSVKAYWSQFESTPEFVIAFLPSEAILSAACEYDPELLEYSAARNVLIATPATLIALLKAVAHGWREESIAENARELNELGRELYDRLRSMAEHVAGLGKSLDRAIDCYNDTVRALDTRVLASARKFKEYGVLPAREIPDLPALPAHRATYVADL